jgi:hypothetical protein
LRIETNLFKYAKLYAGASYRIALGTNMTYPTSNAPIAFTNKDFSGWNTEIGLKLGLFDFKWKKKTKE